MGEIGIGRVGSSRACDEERAAAVLLLLRPRRDDERTSAAALMPTVGDVGERITAASGARVVQTAVVALEGCTRLVRRCEEGVRWRDEADEGGRTVASEVVVVERCREGDGGRAGPPTTEADGVVRERRRWRCMRTRRTARHE